MGSSERRQHAVGDRLGFVRGERFIAATGMAFVSTLILVLVSMGWVTTRSIEKTNKELLESSATQVAKILAAQAEDRLQDEDLSGLRRLMLDAGASGGIEHCAVVVPGGGVLASTSATEITIETLQGLVGAPPASDDRLVQTLEDGRVEVREPLKISTGGVVVLEVTTQISKAHGLAAAVRTASVLIGAAGLLATLWIYRRFRSKLGGIAAVGESLLAFTHGEQRASCLKVADSFGPEAQAWNQILTDRESIARESMNHEIREALLLQKGEGVGVAEACNALTQGVVVVDSDMQVLYTNGAACAFFGLEKDASVGVEFSSVCEDSELIEAVRSTLNGQGGARCVVEIGDLSKIRDGGTILKISVSNIPECEDQRVVLMIQDITQQRLSDESRNSLMAQATHELRTPLTNIKLYVEEAIEAGEDDEAMRDMALNVINKEARRLERVISDMMCVSEIEAGSLSIREGDVRIDQMVDDLVADYQPQAKDKSIELQFDLPPKMPVLHADRDRIAQALHNLIGNAIKYTPDGGKVGVEFAFGDDDSMSVVVTDTGIGIDPDECTKIFEKFYRADDRRINDVTGSGLGLALAREIARLHGGDITVESEIDQGSTFTFFIPGTPGMSKAA